MLTLEAFLTEPARARLHFRNPPIIEAVIFFTVALLPESTLLRFEGLCGTNAVSRLR